MYHPGRGCWWWGMLSKGRGAEGKWELYSTQFCCEPKTAVLNKIYTNIIIHSAKGFNTGFTQEIVVGAKGVAVDETESLVFLVLGVDMGKQTLNIINK